MNVVINGNTYTVSDKPRSDGWREVTDSAGVLVGVVHEDAAFLATVPPDAPDWKNPDPGPRGLVVLRVRDAWLRAR